MRGRKPYLELADRARDADAADDAWRAHLARENHVVTALFTGMLRSATDCAETGERSVWDQELASDRDAAAAFGASTKPPPKRKSTTSIKTKDAPKKPRHQAKAEQARDAQRDAAKSRLPAARACRARFLLAHKDALAPFKPSLNWCKEAAKKAPQRVVIAPFERTPS